MMLLSVTSIFVSPLLTVVMCVASTWVRVCAVVDLDLRSGHDGHGMPVRRRPQTAAQLARVRLAEP